MNFPSDYPFFFTPLKYSFLIVSLFLNPNSKEKEGNKNNKEREMGRKKKEAQNTYPLMHIWKALSSNAKYI